MFSLSCRTSWLLVGSGSKKNGCAVASRPLLFAKTSVLLFVGTKWSCWSQSGHELVHVAILGGFSVISCSVRQESWFLIAISVLSGAWPAASCSGGALLPPVSFLLSQGWVYNREMWKNLNCSFCWSWVFVPSWSCPLFLHPHRAWPPGTTQACLCSGSLVPEHVHCLSLSHWAC